MKQILVMMAAVVALVGCSNETPEPTPVSPAEEKSISIADPIVEKAVRIVINKPEGKLTETDLGKITGLSLSDTKITDAGLKEVAKLQNLTELNLDGSKITDVGLKEVAKLQKLETLWLISTQITDAGLKELAKLQKLTWLDLSDTKITDAGVAELKKALPNCSIYGP